MSNSIQYWLNIKGGGWVEVGLLEYRKSERIAQMSNARLTDGPETFCFCYTGKEGKTEGRILKPGGETYHWDKYFRHAVQNKAAA